MTPHPTPGSDSRIVTSPSFSPTSTLPAQPVKQAGSFSLNQLGKALTMKAVGITEAVQVIDAAAEPHHQLDSTALVLDLKKPNVRPESIRAFAELNTRFLLTVKGALADTPSVLKDNRAHILLTRRVDSSLEKLHRDLRVPLYRGDTLVNPGMLPSDIKALTPFIGMPPITSVPLLGAVAVIIEGSGIGAAIQGKRQAKTFALTGELNGGAEYLNSYGSPPGQIFRLVRELRRLNPLFKVASAHNEACQMTVSVFEILRREFSEKSRFLAN